MIDLVTSKATGFCQHFSETLQGSCREYDYVARMGGDEFVIVAPGLSASAQKLAAFASANWRAMLVAKCVAWNGCH